MASAIDILTNGYDTVISHVSDIASDISAKQIALGAGVTAGVVALGVGAVVLAKKRKARKKKGRMSAHARDRRFKSKEKHEQRHKRKRKYKVYKRKGWIHPKRNSKGNRGVKYTKHGQPYIILKSGKARFIKKTKRRT